MIIAIFCITFILFIACGIGCMLYIFKDYKRLDQRLKTLNMTNDLVGQFDKILRSGYHTIKALQSYKIRSKF